MNIDKFSELLIKEFIKVVEYENSESDRAISRRDWIAETKHAARAEAFNDAINLIKNKLHTGEQDESK